MARRLSLLFALGVVAMMLAPPAAAGGGCHGGTKTGMTVGTGNEMSIDGCLFESTVFYVEPGDEVTWTNDDVYEHSVSGANYSWGSDELLGPGDEVTHVFADEGVFPYYCVLHPGMVGAVVVTEDAKGLAVRGGGGIPNIEEKAVAAPPTQPISETNRPALLMVGFAALAAIALTVLAARRVAVRRRAPAATPAP